VLNLSTRLCDLLKQEPVDIAPNDFVDEMPGAAHEIFEMEGSAAKFDVPAEKPVVQTDQDAPLDLEIFPESIGNKSDMEVSRADLDVSPADSYATTGDSVVSPMQTTDFSARVDAKDGKT
jgi:hypothetical protein